MMTKHEKGVLFGFGVIFTALAMLSGLYLERLDYRGRAVELGYAQYNQSTGAWQWKPTPTITVEETSK